MYNERKFIEKIFPKIAESAEITKSSRAEQTFFTYYTKKHFTIYGFWCMLVVETNKNLKGGC